MEKLEQKQFFYKDEQYLGTRNIYILKGCLCLLIYGLGVQLN